MSLLLLLRPHQAAVVVPTTPGRMSLSYASPTVATALAAPVVKIEYSEEN